MQPCVRRFHDPGAIILHLPQLIGAARLSTEGVVEKTELFDLAREAQARFAAALEAQAAEVE